MSATPETRALVRRIQDVRFTTGRVRTSYDMNDVDELLDRLVDLIEAGSDARDLVSAAEFRTVRWREGYTLGEVDNFLDALLLDPALTPGGTAVAPTVTKAGGRAVPRSSGPPTGPTQAVPSNGSAPAQGSRSRAAAPATGAPATPGGSTRRGGRTVGGMLWDHLEETGKPMPAGDTAAGVRAAAERLDLAVDADEVDVLAVAVDLADIVLAAAAVAEHYGFTVEEAVREKTRLDRAATRE